MLKIAYLNTAPQERARKPTKKEALHAEAIATLAYARARDKEKAHKLFAPERAEVEALKQQLEKLKCANHHN